MPSKILRSLNQCCRAVLTAAEVNAVNRGFAAISFERLSGQRVKIYGMSFSATALTPADRPNLRLTMSLQRNLIITLNTSFPLEEDDSQAIFKQSRDPDDGLADFWSSPEPLVLEPGESYAMFLNIAPLAAFAGAATLLLTLFGSFEAVTSDGGDITL